MSMKYPTVKLNKRTLRNMPESLRLDFEAALESPSISQRRIPEIGFIYSRQTAQPTAKISALSLQYPLCVRRES